MKTQLARTGVLGCILLAGVIGLAGCRVLRTGVRTVDEKPAEGIVLSEGARRLNGVEISDVCEFVGEPDTATVFPLQSDTMRNVVEKVKPAAIRQTSTSRIRSGSLPAWR